MRYQDLKSNLTKRYNAAVRLYETIATDHEAVLDQLRGGCPNARHQLQEYVDALQTETVHLHKAHTARASAIPELDEGQRLQEETQFPETREKVYELLSKIADATVTLLSNLKATQNSMVEIGIGKVKRSSFSAAVEHVYTCCCGVFHVKSAVLMVASIFVMLPFLLPLQYLFYRKNLSDETMDEYRYTHMFIFEVGTCLSQAFCALLVFAAIRKEKKKLLLPFLYSQYFAIAFTIALTLVIIFDPQTWFKNIEKYEGVSTSVMISTSIVASVFHSLVRFWIAGIVKKAYQYLADMEKASKVEKLPRF